MPAFHDFFDSTAKHMKMQRYTWVELDPPWQWTEVNGLPEVVNDIKNAPNYPDDEVHRVIGLKGNTFQSLYHFTVGGAVEDPRLTTYQPYFYLKKKKP